MGMLLQQEMGSCFPCGVPWQVMVCSRGSALCLLESALRWGNALWLGSEPAAERQALLTQSLHCVLVTQPHPHSRLGHGPGQGHPWEGSLQTALRRWGLLEALQRWGCPQTALRRYCPRTALQCWGCLSHCLTQ